MNRWFHPEFETDLISAARFYETQRPHLGVEFVDEAESAVESVMSAPLLWPTRIGGVRRFLLPRFSYVIRYLITADTAQFPSSLHGGYVARNGERLSGGTLGRALDGLCPKNSTPPRRSFNFKLKIKPRDPVWKETPSISEFRAPQSPIQHSGHASEALPQS